MGFFDFLKIIDDKKEKKEKKFDFVKSEWQFDSALKVYCKEMNKKARELNDEDYDIIWEYASDYIGILLTWLISNDYFVDVSNKLSKDIDLVKREHMTGTEFLLKNLDATLTREDISDEIIDFIDFYFDLYVKDFCGIMKVDYQKSCYTAFDWQEYDTVVEIINARLNEFKVIQANNPEYYKNENSKSKKKTKRDNKTGFINPENNLLEYKDEGIDIFEDDNESKENIDEEIVINEKKDNKDNNVIESPKENKIDNNNEEKEEELPDYDDLEAQEFYQLAAEEDKEKKLDIDKEKDEKIDDKENHSVNKKNELHEKSLYEVSMNEENALKQLEKERLGVKYKKRNKVGKHSIEYDKSNPVDDVVNELVEELSENNNYEPSDYVEVPYVEENNDDINPNLISKKEVHKDSHNSINNKKNRKKTRIEKNREKKENKSKDIELNNEKLDITLENSSKELDTDIDNFEEVKESENNNNIEIDNDIIEESKEVDKKADNFVDVNDDKDIKEDIEEEIETDNTSIENSDVNENFDIKEDNKLDIDEKDKALFNVVANILDNDNNDLKIDDIEKDNTETLAKNVYEKINDVLDDESLDKDLTDSNKIIDLLNSKEVQENLSVNDIKDKDLNDNKDNLVNSNEVIEEVVENKEQDNIELDENEDEDKEKSDEINNNVEKNNNIPDEEKVLKHVEKKTKFKKKNNPSKESRKKKKKEKHNSKR